MVKLGALLRWRSTRGGMEFLRARWRNDFLLVSYAGARHVACGHTSPGLTLDRWEGRACVSLVAFDFADTRVAGARLAGLPALARKSTCGSTCATGDQIGEVVFIREYVPSRWVAWLARTLYGEPYRAVPMALRAPWRRRGHGATRSGWADAHRRLAGGLAAPRPCPGRRRRGPFQGARVGLRPPARWVPRPLPGRAPALARLSARLVAARHRLRRALRPAVGTASDREPVSSALRRRLRGHRGGAPFDCPGPRCSPGRGTSQTIY